MFEQVVRQAIVEMHDATVRRAGEENCPAMTQQIKLACILSLSKSAFSTWTIVNTEGVTAGDSVQCGFWSPNWCTCSHRRAQWLWQNDFANDHRRSRYSGRPFSHSERRGFGRFWRMAKICINYIMIIKPSLVNVSQLDIQNHHKGDIPQNATCGAWGGEVCQTITNSLDVTLDNCIQTYWVDFEVRGTWTSILDCCSSQHWPFYHFFYLVNLDRGGFLDINASSIGWLRQEAVSGSKKTVYEEAVSQMPASWRSRVRWLMDVGRLPFNRRMVL